MRSSIGDCCFDCAKRHPACHDTCAEYKAAKTIWEKRKRFIRVAKDKEWNLDSIMIARMEKSRKRNQ